MGTYICKWNDKVFVVLASDIKEAVTKIRYLSRVQLNEDNVKEIFDAVIVTARNSNEVDLVILG